jgi:hypothetical protein
MLEGMLERVGLREEDCRGILLTLRRLKAAQRVCFRPCLLLPTYKTRKDWRPGMAAGWITAGARALRLLRLGSPSGRRGSREIPSPSIA